MSIKETPSLDFLEAFKSATNKITQFQGRSRRSEYWWVMLVVYLAGLVLTPLFGIFLNILTIPLTFRRLHDIGKSGWWWGFGAILQTIVIFSLFGELVMLGMNIDSLHSYSDDFLSVFFTKYIVYVVLFLIIAIYKIGLLVFMCLDSEKCENKYGKSPKYDEVND